METVLSPSEMRAADEATIRSGILSQTLIERAGAACASVAAGMLQRIYGSRVVVVCGKGNNGADGIAAAGYLRKWGASVKVITVNRELTGATDFGGVLPNADLYIDAIFGTGFFGAPRDTASAAISALTQVDGPVLSIDIPSGVSGVDGRISGLAVCAAVTVAIQSLKHGHVTNPGATKCGRIVVADIGIAVPFATVNVPAFADVAGVLPVTDLDSHKYKVGAVVMFAGSPGMTGAATLAASAAMRAGAGMVVLATPECCIDQIAVPEAVTVGVPHDNDGLMTADALKSVGAKLDKMRCIAIGPGLGRSQATVELVGAVLNTDLPVVIDADGLWAVAALLSDDADVLRSRSAPVVLTPHTGEFKTLGGDTDLPAIDAAIKAASKWGAVVHLKGGRPVTAAPDGRAWINVSGDPEMATAGSGDVLTGVIASLIAQGLGAADATWAGAWLHGRSGRLASKRFGTGLVAHDIVDNLSEAFIKRTAQVVGPVRTVVER